jgi:predicted ATP-dependent protease
LTRTQGVIIPYQNIKELMLREDIIESVRNGKFHIYPISRVEEGIEILTGVPAGKKLKNGYEPGSVFDLVEKKIKDLYARSKAVRPANNFLKQRKTARLPARKKRR